MAEKNNTIEFLIPDESARSIFVFDEITAASAKQFMDDLYNIDYSDRQILKKNNHNLMPYGINCDNMHFPPINVFLNSPGGYVYDGFSMYDMVNKRDNLFVTGMGVVASSALFFMLGFKPENRCAYKNTSFLIHQVSSFTAGTVADMEEDVKESKRLNDMIFNVILENTKITKSKLEKVYKQKSNWWANAEEALKLGIINKII